MMFILLLTILAICILMTHKGISPNGMLIARCESPPCQPYIT